MESHMLLLPGCRGVPEGPIAPTSYIVDRLEHIGPAGTPRNPAGATCNFPFFDSLEAEFEKFVTTKVVDLAMIYLVNFEN